MTDNKLAWGILGTGGIAKRFAQGLAGSQTGRLVAVGSRTAESAEEFGEKFEAPNRHGSYDALLADPEVGAVYIAIPHPLHAEWAIKAAEAGKHVLCEKPLTVNYPEAMAVVEAARRNGTFLLEAFMYRCHPQTDRLRELLREKAIGEVRIIQATFSFHATFNAEGRLFNNELGGGGILDVGCYCVSMARLIAGFAQGKEFADPATIDAVGHIGESGVDEYTVAILKFPGDIVAQLSCGTSVNQENVVRIFGSEGSIEIPAPWFCAQDQPSAKIIVNRKGRGVEEIAIPNERDLYSFEADVTAVNLAAGQASEMSWEDSLGNMATLDRWRKAIGVTYAAETAEANAVPVSKLPLKVRPGGNMIYGRIAGCDKPVSRLVLGTMLEGAEFPVAHGAVLFDNFIEHGGTCFDTAHVYGSERVVGRWLSDRGVREQVVLIGKGAHTPNCNPVALTQQLGETLERLRTDYLDLYMMHRDNLDIPVDEFVDVLNEHLKAGRIRSFGGSNWSMARIDAANAYAKSKGLTGFTALSNNFSLARMVDPVWPGGISSADPESRAWLTETQTPLFAWSSQARGFFVRGDPQFQADYHLTRSWYSDDNFERLARVRELSRRRGVEPINIAAAYVLCQPFPTYALIGPRSPNETLSCTTALGVELSPEELKWLNLESESAPLD